MVWSKSTHELSTWTTWVLSMLEPYLKMEVGLQFVYIHFRAPVTVLTRDIHPLELLGAVVGARGSCLQGDPTMRAERLSQFPNLCSLPQGSK